MPALIRPLLASAFLLNLGSLTAESQPEDAANQRNISWQSSAGTHYRLATDSWIGTTRGYPRWGDVAFKPDVSFLKPQNIEPVTGRFSGEPRYFCFRAGPVIVGDVDYVKDEPGQESEGEIMERLDPDARDAREAQKSGGKNPKKKKQNLPNPGETWTFSKDYIADALEADALGIDLVWVAGQISPYQGLIPDKVDYVMAKKGAYLKDTLYATYVAVNTGEAANRKNTIYWEIGNEVNSSHRFSLRDLTDGEHVSGHPEHAKDYVEFYLAPSVEALRTAAQEVYGDPERVKILMGSVSGILKEENQEFLDIILESTIEGTHAPTLAGKKVSDVVDAAVVHYSNGERRILQNIYDKWVATGKVPTLWTTEELGVRGRGDYNVALVSYRWLDFILDNPWTDGQPGRFVFWGDAKTGHPGEKTVGAAALKIIGERLKDYPLSNAQAEVVPDMRADLEWYAFRADAPDGARIYTFYATPYKVSAPALIKLRIKPESVDGGLDLDLDAVSVEAFSIATGKETVEVDATAKVEDEGLVITWDAETAPVMPLGESLLVFVTLSPAATPMP